MKRYIFLLFLFSPSLLFPQTKKTVNLEQAGALSSYIDVSEKYTITELILAGQINGSDIQYIREMAGGSQFDGFTDGKLTILDIENAMIVQGGSYKSGGHEFYTSNLEIGQSMFAELKNIESIILPKTTKAIGINSFYYCTKLQNVKIPDNTFSINTLAFSKCESLEYVFIGKNTEEIRDGGIFSFCKNLKYFIVSPDNENYKSVDGVLYSIDEKTIICYPNAKASKYTIPDNVNKISIAAFSGCEDLEYIEIPKSVTDIGDYAFSSCTSLKSVTLPDNFLVLSGTFYGCTSLLSVTIPSKVQRIFDSFDWCENLKEIYSKNPMPPSNAYFNGVNTIDCKVYVPKGSYDAYYKAEGWRNFLNIIEKDMTSIQTINDNADIYSGNGKICVKSNIIDKINIYSITGLSIPVTLHAGLNEIPLPKGIYIVKNKKIIIQ